MPPSFPNNRRAAVSLTYDDGIAIHPDFVAPELEAHGLRGTFYAPLKSDLMQRPLAWRRMAERGHELGNHTVFHPCWSVGGRYSAWLPEEFNLEQYTPQRWQEEISLANRTLALVDGQNERTFGNTCFDNWLGPQDAATCLEELAVNHFVAMRGEGTDRPVDLDHLNRFNLGTIWADRRAFTDFTGELEALMEGSGWIIYTMHGVGEGSHDHFIDTEEHRRLLAYLEQHSDVIWTAPVIEVVRWLAAD